MNAWPNLVVREHCLLRTIWELPVAVCVEADYIPCFVQQMEITLNKNTTNFNLCKCNELYQYLILPWKPTKLFSLSGNENRFYFLRLNNQVIIIYLQVLFISSYLHVCTIIFYENLQIFTCVYKTRLFDSLRISADTTAFTQTVAKIYCSIHYQIIIVSFFRWLNP